VIQSVSGARRKSRNIIDAIRSPARERMGIDVGTFSLSSRPGLQSEIVIPYVSEFVATYISAHERFSFNRNA